MTLEEGLANWQDFDGACFILGVCLGFWPDDWLKYGLGNKWVFWSNNPLGNVLYRTLDNLVDQNVLLYNEEEGQFKWNFESNNPISAGIVIRNAEERK